MEAATVTLPAVTGSSSYVPVTFRRAYATSPVVALVPTTETPDPAIIRIRNVTTTGFEAAQAEPASQDGTQGAMTMHYCARQLCRERLDREFRVPEVNHLDPGL